MQWSGTIVWVVRFFLMSKMTCFRSAHAENLRICGPPVLGWQMTQFPGGIVESQCSSESRIFEAITPKLLGIWILIWIYFVTTMTGSYKRRSYTSAPPDTYTLYIQTNATEGKARRRVGLFRTGYSADRLVNRCKQIVAQLVHGLVHQVWYFSYQIHYIVEVCVCGVLYMLP